MGLATLERHIVFLLKLDYPELKNMRVKDLMEWSTSPVKAQEGEVLYETKKGEKYYCAVKNTCIKPIKLK